MSQKEDKLQRYFAKHNYTPEQILAYHEIQKRYKNNRIRKLNDNLSRGATTFKGNQEFTDKLDEVTYSVISNVDQVQYVAIGNGIFESRILKQPPKVTEYELDPETRKWVEVIDDEDNGHEV
jgi:hypothetical protein